MKNRSCNYHYHVVLCPRGERTCLRRAWHICPIATGHCCNLFVFYMAIDKYISYVIYICIYIISNIYMYIYIISNIYQLSLFISYKYSDYCYTIIAIIIALSLPYVTPGSLHFLQPGDVTCCFPYCIILSRSPARTWYTHIDV